MDYYAPHRRSCPRRVPRCQHHYIDGFPEYPSPCDDPYGHSQREHAESYYRFLDHMEQLGIESPDHLEYICHSEDGADPRADDIRIEMYEMGVTAHHLEHYGGLRRRPLALGMYGQMHGGPSGHHHGNMAEHLYAMSGGSVRSGRRGRGPRQRAEDYGDRSVANVSYGGRDDDVSPPPRRSGRRYEQDTDDDEDDEEDDDDEDETTPPPRRSGGRRERNSEPEARPARPRTGQTNLHVQPGGLRVEDVEEMSDEEVEGGGVPKTRQDSTSRGTGRSSGVGTGGRPKPRDRY